MATPLRFFIDSTDLGTLGCITSWDGILSEGPINADIIQQDWRDGAEYQQGHPKVYSFEVPLTFHTDVLDPELADAVTALGTIKDWRGPILHAERQLPKRVGGVITTVREVADVVMVSDLQVRVQAGRFVSTVLVMQNLDGRWTPLA